MFLDFPMSRIEWKLLKLTMIMSVALGLGAVAHAEDFNSKVKIPTEDWSLHFQATTVPQGHPGFRAEYNGANSLLSLPEFKTSLTSTLFLGRRLWKGSEAYVNPEISAGKGVSSTLGVAGFPNGEIYRVDTPSPKFNLSRLYLKQIFALSNEIEHAGAEINQLRGDMPLRRLTLIAGKFSLNDFFDRNAFSHDPRTQFLNWALMDNGAWDYAADTRGYTWSIYLEYNQEKWSVRLATAMEPKQANKMELDSNIAHAHGDQIEIEHRYQIHTHPGAIRLLGYMNHAHMGSYVETLANPDYNRDITLTRAYRTKYGFGLNAEQEITPDLGVFTRIGWNDGQTETWAFTEIDRTLSFGMNLKGTSWGRVEDVVGLALIINGLSSKHAEYLAAGGYGFIIGSGRLTYAPEQITEAFYLWKPFTHLGVTPDFQFVNHPAYNQDRGPVFFYAVRVHYEI